MSILIEATVALHSHQGKHKLDEVIAQLSGIVPLQKWRKTGSEKRQKAQTCLNPEVHSLPTAL